MRKVRSGMLEMVMNRLKPAVHQPRKLIVGLGNPGRRYARSRHNMGFRVVERLARENAIDFSRRQKLAAIGEGNIAEMPVALAKPRTFVNGSGQAVDYLLTRYRTSPSDLVVVYDDMDLAPGKIRLRARGSGGGHRGMKSIIAAIGTQAFIRVRIGIGRPESPGEDIEHVLGKVSREERELVEEAVKRASDAVVCVLAEGIDRAMDLYN